MRGNDWIWLTCWYLLSHFPEATPLVLDERKNIVLPDDIREPFSAAIDAVHNELASEPTGHDNKAEEGCGRQCDSNDKCFSVLEYFQNISELPKCQYNTHLLRCKREKYESHEEASDGQDKEHQREPFDPNDDPPRNMAIWRAAGTISVLLHLLEGAGTH